MAAAALRRLGHRIASKKCFVGVFLTPQRTAAQDAARTQFSMACMSGLPESERDGILGFTEVRGQHIHYQKVGYGNHTVLLLPGALGCSRTDFSVQLDTMNRDLFTMIAWDPVGCGNSITRDRDWSGHFLERDAHDVANLMRNLEHPKFSLMGWSDGGMTAMILAACYPEQVRKLVVWGSNAFVTPDDVQTYENLRDINTWSERMRKTFLDEYDEPYFRKQWSLFVDTLHNFVNEKDGNICKEYLEKITCPTLIIHGEKDPLKPVSHAEYLKDNIKNSRFIMIPDGKHNLHKKHYRQFNSLVENFLLEP